MPIIRGTRSSHDLAVAWTCQNGHYNPPQRLLLFDLPTFICGCGCGQEWVGDFEYCMADIMVNGHGLLGEPLDQGAEGRCVPFAFAKLVEITRRMKALHQNKDPDDIPEMSPWHLSRSYEERVGVGQDLTGLTEVVVMAQILKEQGIQSVDTTTIYKVPDVSVIRRNQIETILKELADGYPLFAGILVGRKLRILRFCERYKPPGMDKWNAKCRNQKRRFIPSHAVILIGAGRKKGKLYYFFLNSWKRFCVRRDSCGRLIRHGIGKIPVRHLLRNLVRVSRFKEPSSHMSLQPQVTIPVTETCYNHHLMKSLKPNA